jgi:hypothetical protein
VLNRKCCKGFSASKDEVRSGMGPQSGRIFSSVVE